MKVFTASALATALTFPSVGIALGGERDGADYTTTALDNITGLLGTGTVKGMVRYGIQWDQSQPTSAAQTPLFESDVNSKWATAMTAFAGRGYEVLMCLSNTPTWARDTAITDKDTGRLAALPWLHPPTTDNVAAGAAWAKRAAAWSIARGVRAFEIWNETNLDFGPALYSERILKPWYTAIKQAAAEANVEVIVIPAGTSPGGYTGTMAWYQALYANGCRHYMDSLATHPYTFDIGSPNTVDASNHFTITKRVYDEIMVPEGDGAKKIWATEVGYPSTVAGNETSKTWTYSEVSTFIGQVMQKWFVDYAAFAGPLQWYCDWDKGTVLTDDFNTQGLATNSYAPKQPAYSTFQTQRATHMKRMSGGIAGQVMPAYGVSPGYTILDYSSAEQDFELNKTVDVSNGKACFIRLDSTASNQTQMNALMAKIATRPSLVPLIILYGSATPGTSLGTFAGDQATKWGAACNHYEIVNEPDMHLWDPEPYADFLKAASQQIKAVRPAAKVIAGALFHGQETTGTIVTSRTPDKFALALAQRAAGHFDMLSMHLYNDPYTRASWNIWDRTFPSINGQATWYSQTRGGGNWTGDVTVRSILNANGLSHIPIISTENGGTVRDNAESDIALFISRAFDVVDSGLLGSQLVYCMRNLSFPDQAQFGMLRPDGTERPAYATFKAKSAGTTTPVTTTDTFDRTASTTTLNGTGAPWTWTAHQGTWGITAEGKAYSVTQAVEDCATFDTTTANMDVSAVVDFAPADYWTMVAAYVDANNYFAVSVNQSGDTYFGKRVAGVDNVFAGLGIIPDGAVLRIVRSGSTWTLYVNGTAHGPYTGHGELSTATRAGMRVGTDSPGDVLLRWDNFTRTV